MRTVITVILAMILSSCAERSESTFQSANASGSIQNDPASDLSAALITGSDESRDDNFWRCNLADAQGAKRILALRFFRSGGGLLSTEAMTWVPVSGTSVTITTGDQGKLQLHDIAFSSRLQPQDGFSAQDDYANRMSCEWEGVVKGNSDGPLSDSIEINQIKLATLLTTDSNSYWTCLSSDASGNVRSVRLELFEQGIGVFDEAMATWYVSENYDLVISTREETHFLSQLYYPEHESGQAKFTANQQASQLDCAKVSNFS